MLHLFKKSTALLLVISMLLGVLCLPAFAVEEGTKLTYLYVTTIPEDGTDLEDLGAPLPDTLPDDISITEGYTHVHVGDGNYSDYWIGSAYISDNSEDGSWVHAFTAK